MKVLFVASGNKSVGRVSAFVQSQYDSLQKEGVEMLMYPVVGHGWKGYAKNLRSLRALIRKEKPDVVHAHYSSCGYLAALATMGLKKTKTVVSILGSFPRKSTKLRIVRFCVDHVWDATLVKSERTKRQLDRDVPVIPNGVNLELFTLIPQEEARQAVGFGQDGKYVIFVSNPARAEKNYGLAEDAVALLDDKEAVLVPVYDRTHDEIVKYMCAADALIMTSLNEGSPNVIKEAMTCNCPLVVTDVGDVRWVTEGIEGTYVADTFNPDEVSGLLRKALEFGKRTEGRKRILQLGLTTDAVAKRILAVYESV